MNPTSTLSTELKAEWLRSLPSIRTQCSKVFALAKAGKLDCWEYHPEKEGDVVQFCADIITRDFGTNYSSIPPHGRWRHFDLPNRKPRIAPLRESWTAKSISATEQTTALIDLFLVSVLLDAGAGPTWKYKEATTGDYHSRSEGLAIASVDMFEAGLFSSVEGEPHRVDAKGLANLTTDKIASAMQVSPTNEMAGIEGRAELLIKLSKALSSYPEFFGPDGRPGHIINFLQKNSRVDEGTTKIHIATLWHILMTALAPIWPSRIVLGGLPLGDVWPCPALAREESSKTSDTEAADLVPFHKLTQWLTYSLVQVIMSGLGWEVEGMEDMTGLPEYRNGGLLIDLGLISLKESVAASAPKITGTSIPRFEASHPAIVEMRAMTVIQLDRIHEQLPLKFGLAPGSLSLPQVLESATWKGGREIAKKLREGGGPPIDIISDGTVF
ncbi:DUF1688-domain-containing protein [Sistotremastrum niveocremeum HHB9708]|uniref:DUF1688-domain-containing protein n=1 Tax=Sistotremastrum niveocremeum HHB9708 TaxID=1314777 RepID=A0A164YAG5_9AGAM|nr:DUF1688-domain-containing protein [Sistotremastrum niveocremeum HHB9708]